MKQYWQKQTNQQNPIFQVWFLEILLFFFLETITITIKITMKNVIINYKIFQVITVLSRDSSSTVTGEVSR